MPSVGGRNKTGSKGWKSRGKIVEIYLQALLDEQVAAERTRQAMYKMNKIDIVELDAGFAGS